MYLYNHKGEVIVHDAGLHLLTLPESDACARLLAFDAMRASVEKYLAYQRGENLCLDDITAEMRAALADAPGGE